MTLPTAPAAQRIPLVESVLAFQFARRSRGWDSLFFGKLHDRLESEFPEVETIQGTEIAIGQGVLPSVSAAPEIKRFSRLDGGMVITIGPETLGVSILARKFSGGYPGWPSLKETALRVLRLYIELTSPDAIGRIGVRYINSIDVEPNTFRLDRYVSELSGIVPLALLKESNPFAFRIDRTLDASPLSTRREILNLVARATPSGGQLVLDVDQLYFATEQTGSIDVAEVADQLHAAIESVFIRVLSAKFRKSLGLTTPPSLKR